MNNIRSVKGHICEDGNIKSYGKQFCVCCFDKENVEEVEFNDL